MFDPQTGKLEHAVHGKQHETTNERKLLHNLKPSLNFAFDLTKSPEMRGPLLTEQDKESLVQRYLNTPKTLNTNAMETWNANIIYEPLAKTAEKIRLENPKIVELAIEKNFESKLGSKVSVEQKKSLMNEVKNLLNEPSNSLFKIEQVLEQRVKESLAKQVQAPTIQTTMPIKGNVVSTPTISEVPRPKIPEMQQPKVPEISQPETPEVQKKKSNWQKFKDIIAERIKTIKNIPKQIKDNLRRLKDEIVETLKDKIVETWKIVKEAIQDVLPTQKTPPPKQQDVEMPKQTIESGPRNVTTPEINQSNQKAIDRKTLVEALNIGNIGNMVKQNIVQPNSNKPTITPQTVKIVETPKVQTATNTIIPPKQETKTTAPIIPPKPGIDKMREALSKGPRSNVLTSNKPTITPQNPKHQQAKNKPGRTL